jgi:hypothetical protein
MDGFENAMFIHHENGRVITREHRPRRRQTEMPVGSELDS